MEPQPPPHPLVPLQRHADYFFDELFVTDGNEVRGMGEPGELGVRIGLNEYHLVIADPKFNLGIGLNPESAIGLSGEINHPFFYFFGQARRRSIKNSRACAVLGIKFCQFGSELNL